MMQANLFEENGGLTLSKLESHLWEAANILRGSPVDRTDWKSYILPLLFFKRICDVWDEEHAQMVETYGEDFADEHRFQVPDECHWKSVRETPTNVGTALSNSLRGIERANRPRNRVLGVLSPLSPLSHLLDLVQDAVHRALRPDARALLAEDG
ncbi:MAG: hypothetical protein CSB49_08735, partial [Proteobacteria bacterium]